MWWLAILLPLYWYFRKIKFTLAFVYRFARLGKYKNGNSTQGYEKIPVEVCETQL